MKTRSNIARQGFGIVVIAALFTAFAVVAAIAIDRNTINKQFDQQAAARAQLSRLSNAILQYYAANSNRYPCPAAYNLARTATYFGQSASSYATPATDTSCATTNASTGIDILTSTTPASGSNIRGMVPVVTLAAFGADLSDAFDPWGNRIMYVVHRQLTPNGSGSATTCAPAANCTQATCACTTITDKPYIIENLTNRSINSADFILISYGPDKIGAFPENYSSAATPAPAPIPCAASTQIRRENCDTDMLFVTRPPYTAPNATTTNRYDDIIGFYAAQ